MSALLENPARYFRYRDDLAWDIKAGRTGQTPEQLMDHIYRSTEFDRADSAEFVEKFLDDLGRHLARRRSGQR